MNIDNFKENVVSQYFQVELKNYFPIAWHQEQIKTFESNWLKKNYWKQPLQVSKNYPKGKKFAVVKL